METDTIIFLALWLCDALSLAGLVFGAIVAPCTFSERPRALRRASLTGLACFILPPAVLSYFLLPQGDCSFNRTACIALSAVMLSFLYAAVWGVAYLIHWRWSLWRAQRKDKNPEA